MQFATEQGCALMHLYLTIHPKKSPAYAPAEEGYLSDEEESRLHHLAEFIRLSERRRYAESSADPDGVSDHTEWFLEGWQDFVEHFTEDVNGAIEFDDKTLPDTFAKFQNDIRRISSRPCTQWEIELAKSMKS